MAAAPRRGSGSDETGIASEVNVFGDLDEAGRPALRKVRWRTWPVWTSRSAANWATMRGSASN